MFAGLLFTFGVIGDRIGRKRMLMIGMAMFGIASLVSSYAHTPEQLILARAAMGFGGAAVMPQTLSIITNVFDPRERPRAIGIWAAAVGVAIAIGPIAGGLLLDHFWWGSVFLINVPLTVFGVAAIMLIVPESKSPSPGKIDYLGVLLSIAGLVLVVYGIIQGGDTGSWLRGDVLVPVAGGLAVAGGFRVVREPDRAIRRWTCGCSAIRGCRPLPRRSRWCSSRWPACTSSSASTCRTCAATARCTPAC